MANSIALAQKYLPLLDEVYKQASRTAILDNTNIEFVNANTVKLFKTEMDGLGDYNRNSGFANGSVTGSWETMTLTQDRGRSFMIDRMDNEETIGQAFGTLASEFLRVHAVPEIDAYTFATMAGASGINSANGDLANINVLEAIDAAGEAMDDGEVPYEGRILFVSEAAYSALKGKIVRSLANESTVQRGVEYLDDMVVVRVPQSRFNTAITLRDGTTSGQEVGGFVPTAGGYKINFMIVHPSAVIKATKHVMPRIFTPDENQVADAWKFDYRVYHDTFVKSAKAKGIYLHRAATANQ